MASPTVEATNTSNNDAGGASHSVNLPSGIVLGSVLVVLFAWDAAGAVVATPFEWHLEASRTQAAGADTVGLAVFSKIATGSEGAVLTVTTTGTPRSVHHSYRIGSGYQVEAAIASSTGIVADPPDLAPSWGSADILVLVGAAVCDESGALSSLPTNYTNSIANESTFNDLASGRRALTGVSSENPGTFTFTAGGSGWVAVTVAIQEILPITEQVSYQFFEDGDELPHWDPT